MADSFGVDSGGTSHPREAGLPRPVDPARFAAHPEDMLWQTALESLAMPAAQLADIQLSALRARFADLHDRLPPLRNLAEAQGVVAIESLNAAAKLLFRHTTYKSYPLSLIEKNRFDRLTSWLGQLTTVDLSTVATQGISTVDDWLDALYRDVGVRVVHSTGTSGKLSFLPRGPAERALGLRAFRLNFELRDTPRDLQSTPMVVIGQRHMYNGYGASLDAVVEQLYGGDESLVFPLDAGRLSADVLSLAGRLAAARSRGERANLHIPPALLAGREIFVTAQKEGPARRAAFYDALAKDLRGRRIMMAANWSMLFEMAEQGKARGLSGVFAPDSLIVIAGGTKGKVLPANFRREVLDFLGVETVAEGFGMSEMTTLAPKCEAGQYHLMPWQIGYLLDHETGEPAERRGTHTGRFGVFDLVAQSYWGGILSGDEVTMTFGTCACGRTGTFIADSIRRYSEMEGGDDKITCAGAPQAQDDALAFLADMQ